MDSLVYSCFLIQGTKNFESIKIFMNMLNANGETSSTNKEFVLQEE